MPVKTQVTVKKSSTVSDIGTIIPIGPLFSPVPLVSQLERTVSDSDVIHSMDGFFGAGELSRRQLN